MGKREENQILSYDSKIVDFFKGMKPKRKCIYLSNHKMCEILGLGLGFSSLVGTKNHLSKILVYFVVDKN